MPQTTSSNNGRSVSTETPLSTSTATHNFDVPKQACLSSLGYLLLNGCKMTQLENEEKLQPADIPFDLPNDQIPPNEDRFLQAMLHEVCDVLDEQESINR
mmetsp:Transcript_28085/g.39537  ORF Transcript_28085/g.39537 Transcript_28085/m.39537 type:complete len:100 (+) Transcript_28085:240-539(+)